VQSLSYTSEPLEADLEITGSPAASLRVALERGEELQLAVRLCAVAPNGASALVTSGWLEVDGRAAGELRIPLWATAYRVPRGHRLRLAVACADFPHLWPTSANPAIGVVGARLHLPV